MCSQGSYRGKRVRLKTYFSRIHNVYVTINQLGNWDLRACRESRTERYCLSLGRKGIGIRWEQAREALKKQLNVNKD